MITWREQKTRGEQRIWTRRDHGVLGTRENWETRRSVLLPRFHHYSFHQFIVQISWRRVLNTSTRDRIGEWPDESEGEDEFQVDKIYPWSRFNFNFFDCTRREEVCISSSKCLKRLFADTRQQKNCSLFKKEEKRRKIYRVSFFVLKSFL